MCWRSTYRTGQPVEHRTPIVSSLEDLEAFLPFKTFISRMYFFGERSDESAAVGEYEYFRLEGSAVWGRTLYC